MMSNRLVQFVTHSGFALDFQPDQLPAAGTADINTFDLHRTYGLRKIRGFTLNTDIVSHGKIPLGHFYNNHLDLGKIMGYFTDRLTPPPVGLARLARLGGLGGLAKR